MTPKTKILVITLLALIAVLSCDTENATSESDAGNNETGDTGGNVTGDTEEDSEPSADGTACGTTEAICSPGETIDCTQIGDGFGGPGKAACLDDCSGWMTAACEKVEQTTTYGTLSISLSAEFILDSARLDEDGYVASHADTIMSTEPFFTGQLAGATLPQAQVRDYEMWVIRSQSNDETIITAVQQAFDENQQLVNPVIELRMLRDDFQTGESAAICLSQSVSVYIYELKTDFSGIGCFHAVSGDATLNIVLADGLTESDGGKLSATATDVPIYYIKETPHGDLSSGLSQPACDRLGK